MDKRERLFSMINEAGYSSVRSFCKKIGIQHPNLLSNLNGTYANITVPRLFKIANGLGKPFDVILEIFYPELMEENKANAEHPLVMKDGVVFNYSDMCELQELATAG